MYDWRGALLGLLAVQLMLPGLQPSHAQERSGAQQVSGRGGVR
jgi:hypothetical protein